MGSVMARSTWSRPIGPATEVASPTLSSKVHSRSRRATQLCSTACTDSRGSPNATSVAAAANPAAPTQAPAPASDGEGRLAGITEAHNKIRAELGIAPLTWSPELAAYAQSWADKLAAGGCGLRHRPESGADRQRYGENIFGVGGYDPSADEVVASWAEEVANYDAKKNRCRGVCGHYTQIVWRKSQRLGCAMASCGDSEIWVCNYDPAGNYVGERPY